MGTSIKALPTHVDGIRFRSRLEASWYAFFKQLKIEALYEPCVIKIENIYCGQGEPYYYYVDAGGERAWDVLPCEGEDSKLYTPDFYLPKRRKYIEIKPLMDEYSFRDKLSMALASILGYTTPTIVVLGSPFSYVAIEFNERRKGNPCGDVVRFDHGCIEIIDHFWFAACYPDETGFDKDNDMLWDDPRNHAAVQTVEPHLKRHAAQAWNETQWKGAASQSN